MKFGIMMAHRKLLALGLTAAAAGSLAIGTMFTGAVFTDQQTDNSTFTTGTIALDAAKIATMDLTRGHDARRHQAQLGQVENDGTAQLRYAVSQSSTNTDTKKLTQRADRSRSRPTTPAPAPFGTDGDYCDDGNRHDAARLGRTRRQWQPGRRPDPGLADG